ncbi:MAG: prepilin-type N-terminal cleavage/methylation domain-containing protein [Armatimonadetes bacterium]|nr:prepilin-type N-terminal cleavage/methylation domain-containing protein [Armatimonadota bacterium]
MKRRGFTLTELLIGTVITAILILTALALLTSGLASFGKTDTRFDLSGTGALAMRRITEELRSAMVVNIATDGRSMTYELPVLAAGVDPVTGEREYVYPLEPDGVVRRLAVDDGTLWHQVGLNEPRPLVKNLSDTDPQEGSAYYGQQYPVFAFASVGSTNGLVVTLISEKELIRTTEVSRMLSTVQLRNNK